MERFDRVLTPHAAQEWLRQALLATWGVEDPSGLNRPGRSLALQRVIHVVYALEDHELGQMLPFTGDGGRAATREAFARRWGGIALEGPPWRLGPAETDRPTHAEWASSADFD